MATLSSSAQGKGVRIDYRAIIDPERDPGVPGGRELIVLAHSSSLSTPDPSSVGAVAAVIGSLSAVTAAEVAASFAMINRVTDTTGCHIPAPRVGSVLAILEELGATDFPNTRLVAVRKNKASRKLRKFVRGLAR